MVVDVDGRWEVLRERWMFVKGYTAVICEILLFHSHPRG
jgi:hypothetical protein